MKHIKSIIISLIILTLAPAFSLEVQKYSFFDKFIDGFRLFFSSGEAKIDLLLEIREKEVNSAIASYAEGNLDEANKSLISATLNLEKLMGLTTLNNTEKISSSISNTVSQLSALNISKAFNDYVIDEQAAKASAQIMEKTYEYCKELAYGNHDSFVNDELCNPLTASPKIKAELETLRQEYNDSMDEIFAIIQGCIEAPLSCSCESMNDADIKSKCEDTVALAIQCEYNNDESSCALIDSIYPQLITYDTMNHSIDFKINNTLVPSNCYNETIEEECQIYWTIPSIKDSIPKCYDAEGKFMDSCGKIFTIVSNNGLINYIIETEINQKIQELLNSSLNNTIDINMTINQTMQEILALNSSISSRIFLEGTFDTGNYTNLINDTIIQGNATNNAINIVINSTGNMTHDVVNIVVNGTGKGNATHDVSTVVVETE
ncbi:MAG: hypothetical protein WC376_00380 [Candidatus Nanoarchaeia archaeon]|jgi:hypothetical protein